MEEKKNPKKDVKPKMKVLDRRHWVDEDKDSDSEGNPKNVIEDRLPNFVEQLKQDAEEKDKRLREYISAYKDKNAENDEFRGRLQKENETRLDQFKAILFASFSSPKYLNIFSSSIPSNLFITSSAEKSLIPIFIFKSPFELKDNPFVGSFICVYE